MKIGTLLGAIIGVCVGVIVCGLLVHGDSISTLSRHDRTFEIMVCFTIIGGIVGGVVGARFKDGK